MNERDSNRETDLLLLPFLRATEEEEVQRHLEQLTALITPVVKKITSRSRHPQDAFQETMQQALNSLWNLKADPDNKAIGDFLHYVAVIAKHVRIKTDGYRDPLVDLDEEGTCLLQAPGPLPDEEAERRQSVERHLRHRWIVIEDMKPLQRIVYLLNFRIADCGVELFQDYGIATMEEIGAILQLSDESFARIWAELGEEAHPRAELQKSYDEKFALLWQHLPLNDNIIARMLGTERQKVINLRRFARARIAKHFASLGQNG